MSAKTRFTISFIILFILFAVALTGSISPSAVAYAATDLNIDSTNVLDDLNGSIIGGKEFNPADYKHKHKIRKWLDFWSNKYNNTPLTK